MSPKIDAMLAKAIKEAQEERFPVIVTTRPGVRASELEEKGLALSQVIESISAICGTLSAGEVAAVAEMESVNTIEYDGQMHALGD